MPRDFYPRREADIVSFTSNLSNQINLFPNEYGVSELMAQEYAIKQEAFSEAYSAVQNSGGNSSNAVFIKEEARIALEAETRAVVGQIRTCVRVRDEQRAKLGLKPRADRRRRLPVPATAPSLIVKNDGSAVLQVAVLDAESNRFALPRDARMASVMRYVGENLPGNRKDWGLLKSSTTTRFSAQLDRQYPPGTSVWLCACWTNSRGERGPWSEPVRTRIQFDGPLQSVELNQAA